MIRRVDETRISYAPTMLIRAIFPWDVVPPNMDQPTAAGIAANIADVRVGRRVPHA
jgi:hypothetical protein